MKKFIMILWVLCLVAPVLAQSDETPESPYRAAADYSSLHNGGAFLVYENNALVFEEYTNGYNGIRRHILASGTKSFTCALAAAAADDGLLSLDEKASATLTEWQGDPERENITLRQLLNLTSGLWGADGVLHGSITADKADTALRVPVMFPSGERFQYGPSHFYVFGEVLKRKLNGEDVFAYLQRRILDPIGLTDLIIVRDKAGNLNLAAGGATTARQWAQYGLFILNNGAWNGNQIVSADRLRECYQGTAANPYYGLAFWLEYDLDNIVELDWLAAQTPEPTSAPETAPRVLIAAGAGKQRMYIIPERGLVVVRLSLDDKTFKDADMLDLILNGDAD